MLHAIALVATIAALNTSSGSIGVSMTVPVICQDYRVGDKVVTHCNDEQPASVTMNGVALGRPYLPSNAHVVDATVQTAAIAPITPAAAGNNAILCVRCSFR